MRQLGLFDSPELGFDVRFEAIGRVELGSGAWLDYGPRWLQGHAHLFEWLANGMRWNVQRRRMYERVVDVPRLFAAMPEDGEGHPILLDVSRTLSRRYKETLSSITMAYYRDGRDSVAWHRDKRIRDRPEGLVAIVSLGEPRRFMVRPLGGGRSRAFVVGWGDLLVMGGTCQRVFEHCVPKSRDAGPRMSIMFRGYDLGT